MVTFSPRAQYVGLDPEETVRHGHFQSPREYVTSTPKRLYAMVTFSPRAQYVSLDPEETVRHGHFQSPRAVRQTRPRRDCTPWSLSVPGRSTSASTPKRLYAMVTFSPRAQYVGLDPEETVRHGHFQSPRAVRQPRPRRDCTPWSLSVPARSTSASTPKRLYAMVTFSPRAQYVSLDPEETIRHGHFQSPRAVRRTRPRRGSNRTARGANPGEDRICRKAQPCKGWTAIT